MKRMVSGIQPSGRMTLGNYLGAIRNFVKLQDEYEMFIFVADMHAITVKQDPIELKSRIREVIALYIACGLDYNKATIFLQSENEYHANLSWFLECNSYIGELSRMTQFKDKSKKGNDNSISVGLFTYPILMASDIILYDPDFVPVGDDQKQHVELARDIAERFNKRYGDTFKIPMPFIPKEGSRIKDLQDPTKKMSKSSESEKGCIYILEDFKKIEKKIMSSVTDSSSSVYYDIINKPGISNLMTIYSAITNLKYDEIEEKFKNENYGVFKRSIVEELKKTIIPIQDRYKEIINSDLIDKVLDQGISKVKPIAKEKYNIVKEKIGLIR